MQNQHKISFAELSTANGRIVWEPAYYTKVGAAEQQAYCDSLQAAGYIRVMDLGSQLGFKYVHTQSEEGQMLIGSRDENSLVRRLYAATAQKIQAHLEQKNHSFPFGFGAASILNRIVMLWASQQAIADQKGLPMNNEVALSFRQINPDGHRKLTAMKHLERLAYMDILQKKEDSENPEGYAIPISKPGKNNRVVYFFNPELCAVMQEPVAMALPTYTKS